MKAAILVLIVALAGLGFLFQSSSTGTIAWNQAYQTYEGCPDICYDERVKATCLVLQHMPPRGGYCYGKVQQGLTSKCSCPMWAE